MISLRSLLYRRDYPEGNESCLQCLLLREYFSPEESPDKLQSIAGISDL